MVPTIKFVVIPTPPYDTSVPDHSLPVFSASWFSPVFPTIIFRWAYKPPAVYIEACGSGSEQASQLVVDRYTAFTGL